MAKTKVEMPNFANATPEFLTDELGDIRDQIKKLEKIKDLISEALKGRARLLKETKFIGERYTSEIVQMSRTGLDTALVKESMDEDWIAAHSKTTEYPQVNVKPIEG